MNRRALCEQIGAALLILGVTEAKSDSVVQAKQLPKRDNSQRRARHRPKKRLSGIPIGTPIALTH